MQPDRLNAIQAIEKDIARNVDALFLLAKQDAPFQEIIIGYQELIEVIGKKYAMICDDLAERALSDIERAAQELNVQKQYTVDIARVAALVDKIRESTQSV